MCAGQRAELDRIFRNTFCVLRPPCCHCGRDLSPRHYRTKNEKKKMFSFVRPKISPNIYAFTVHISSYRPSMRPRGLKRFNYICLRREKQNNKIAFFFFHFISFHCTFFDHTFFALQYIIIEMTSILENHNARLRPSMILSK